MQYEENPYPRWINFPTRNKKNFSDSLEWIFSHFTSPLFFRERVECLVAGCGTGKDPISLAMEFDNINISAVDLSKSSLAYVIRMARKLGADNIHFRQDDILNLSMISQKFHFISCSGVLHHLEQPVEGWKILTDLLLPAGVMRIGLYSERSRRHIVNTRDRIQRAGLEPTKGDIRKFRKEIFGSAPGTMEYSLLEASDFYSLSNIRDLLFHV
jgi:ubiquinone/menaquinone biosynthesis C-methylase UbiE